MAINNSTRGASGSARQAAAHDERRSLTILEDVHELKKTCTHYNLRFILF
jgi:hypothetical protein